ncbi:Endoglucanase OS=Streptomyces tendae OX=1932 GN=F3L20_16695 PE=3 SV=1 [Streptomyces tendae]
MKRRRTALLTLTGLLATALTAMPAAPAGADEVEQVRNGTFDNGTEPWWASEGVTAGASDGRLCADVPGGTANRWDAIVGHNDIALQEGETYRFSFSATGSPAGHVVRAIVGLPGGPVRHLPRGVAGAQRVRRHVLVHLHRTGEHGPGAGRLPARRQPRPLAVLRGRRVAAGRRRPRAAVPDTGPRVRVNQVGYLPAGPKNATLVTDATEKLPWQLKDGRGRVVRTGWTVPRGVDASSGQNVHSVDFGSYRGRGTGFTLTADGETGRPFDIDAAAYERLRLDSAKYYYTQRSGVEIREDLRPGYGRPAGHVGVAPNQGDGAVPCRPGECDYTLDVTGGWYDAGDHEVRRQRRHRAPGSCSAPTSAPASTPARAGRTSWATGRWTSPRAATRCPTSSTRPAGSWSSC